MANLGEIDRDKKKAGERRIIPCSHCTEIGPENSVLTSYGSLTVTMGRMGPKSSSLIRDSSSKDEKSVTTVSSMNKSSRSRLPPWTILPVVLKLKRH